MARGAVGLGGGLLSVPPSVVVPVVLLAAVALLRAELALVLPVVVLLVVLLARIVMTPVRTYWKSGEAAETTDLDSATISSGLKGRLAQVSAMGKPNKSRLSRAEADGGPGQSQTRWIPAS